MSLEERAQTLIIDAAKEIISIQDEIDIKNETIKEIRADVKGEGLNIKALNSAIKRYRAYLQGKKEVENDLDEADIYLNVLQENLV